MLVVVVLMGSIGGLAFAEQSVDTSKGSPEAISRAGRDGIIGGELARRLEQAGYVKGAEVRTTQGTAHEYTLKSSSYTILYLVPADPGKIVLDPEESVGDRKVNVGWDNGPRLYMTGTDFWNLGKAGLQELCGKLPWGSRTCGNAVERIWNDNLTGPGRILNDGRCWDLSQTLNIGWRPAPPEKCK
ncbi:hypothetical protein [Pseudonocardia sp. ICBG1293]|uniref:hypothetical protein n=1 Tax=Pseudonocardia sp. ICBG1293 TaxID=2844382 RepID=UPI001CCB3555|nr:hypothetical protein [Pseudonocardia sp. ICBG1293]